MGWNWSGKSCSGGIGGQVTGISSPYFGDFSGTRRYMVLRSASLVPGTGHTCHSVIPKKEPTTNDRTKLWARPWPPSFICSQGDCRADIPPPCSHTVSCIHLGPEQLHPAWLLLPPQAQSLLFWSSWESLFPQVLPSLNNPLSHMITGWAILICGSCVPADSQLVSALV